MKRATALKVLAATLVVLTVASALPLTLLLQEQDDPAGASSPPSSTSPSSQGAATRGLPFGPAGNPDAGLPADGADGSGGPSSRPGLAGAAARGSGSALLDQVIGAARLMGVEAEVPDLPLHKLDPVNPLRAAILGWIAVTHAQVPADELDRELARADALPAEVQRDVALLLLAASDAVALQREATVLLTPEQLAWIYAHPEVAADLAQGIDTPETRQLAILAGLVDVKRSVQASLLLLTAVEATRGSLGSHETKDALALLDDSPDLDPATQAVLRVLATAGAQTTDQEKVVFAARLVAATTGAPLPEPALASSFGDAVARLAAATAQTPDADELTRVLARADALPDDLADALASILLAQALAVEAAAASDVSTEAQGQAMARVLVTVAQALPTLEKHSLYWRNAPDALRVGQWSPQARIGWALEHAAHLVSTRGDAADVARAAAFLHGTRLQQATVPERDFVAAYIALATEDGAPPNATVVAEVRRAAETLEPRVAKAAAIMMSGAAESARLQREAFAGLSADERDTLLASPPLDEPFLRDDLTQAEVDELATLSALAARVDRAALARAQLVGILATTQARDLLDGLQTQGHARPVSTGLLGLLERILPWSTASAQSSGGCVPILRIGTIVRNDCENDVLLVLERPNFFRGGSTCPFVPVGEGRGCAEATSPADPQILVITGADRTRNIPITRVVFLPDPSCAQVCPFVPVTRTFYGAARVHLDLGGSDIYARPVAMTFPTQDTPVSLHLDMGGSDDYQDASHAFGEETPLWRYIGTRDGHPTQGSAVGGGVAILFDNGLDQDQYQAPGLSQGYGQWGLGMLVDAGGTTDYYSATRLSQGAAGRDFNLGLGVLLDAGGDDRYRARSGHGYGTGGILVDLGGADTYANEHPAVGAPVVHLRSMPGGNLTTLKDRQDNSVWVDGQAQLNLGLGIDVETRSTDAKNSDGDLLVFSDFVETVFGTDPYDRNDGPDTRPTAQAEKLVVDQDEDGYPDFVERAFSTDAGDNRSMPFSLPIGPTFVLPPPLGEVTPGRQAANTAPVGAKGSDKVIDLRMPLQDAGSIDFACTGPLGIMPNGFSGSNAMNLTVHGVATKDETSGTPDGPCLIVGYSSSKPGEATLADPGFASSGLNAPGGSDNMFRNRTLRYPVGILAIGDSVPTTYDVDYFLVVDLGGNDLFTNSAGGPLAVRRTLNSNGLETDTILAPSLVLNVDVSARSTAPTAVVDVRNPDGALGDDTYANASRDYVHGSMWGILLDTQGDDNYTAGSASQGALGGLLLDLEGSDAYRANDLSQGATIIGDPSQAQARRAPGMPDVKKANAERLQGSDLSPATPVRRAPPGLALDLGEDADVRKARNASQGFARGFGSTPSALWGAGILVDQGGNDQYLTRSDHGRGMHAQAVATAGGVAILYDAKGNDTYSAWGVVSQGASVSQSSGASPTTREGDRSAPGLALLLDTGGGDAYEYANLLGVHDRTAARQDRLTIQRGELAKGETTPGDAKSLYADPSIHYDGEDASLGAVLGTGSRAPTSLATDKSAQQNVNDFYVDIPSARLAVGGPKPTRYEHQYAFVVDLGGSNVYLSNAGGVVTDVLAESDSGGPSSLGGGMGGHDATMSLFPVSFVFDAGDDASVYQAQKGLVQGAGYFSVGVLADLGGNDRFVALPRPIPSLGVDWATVPPTIDGSLNEPVWNSMPERTLLLVDVNDSRFAQNLSLRVANDKDALYFAISGQSPSHSQLVENDLLRIDVNPGRTLQERAGAEIDSILVRLGASGQCEIMDGHYNATRNPPGIYRDWGEAPPGRTNVHGEASCTLAADGSFVVEVSKPLRPGIPRDEQDLDLVYDQRAGFSKADQQGGIRVSYVPAGPGNEMAWPPGTVRKDGELSFRRDNDLSDEIAAWGSFALASLGVEGVPLNATLTPALSQGSGIAGVGILAHLGTLDSANAYVASDRAQGYGAFDGIGLLLDMGNSDEYRGTTRVQGYSDASGLGALVDFEGNDNYRSIRDALGATPPGSSTSGAIFADLGGLDEYDTAVPARDREALGASNGVPREVGSPTPFGQLTVWRTGYGLGADYLTQDNVRGVGRGVYASQWFGVSRTVLTVLRTDDTGDACTTPSRETVQGEERTVATGVVCLRADVDLTRGLDRSPGTTFSIDAVDFLVGGHRFATVNATQHNWTLEGMSYSQPSRGKHTFTVRLDTRELEDGVAPITAVSLIRAATEATASSIELGQRGAVVFYDQATEGNVRASVPALINNPVRATLHLWPEFDAGADAAFSPRSAIAGKDRLQIDWNVSHDAGEDRYGLKHGWVAPPELSNVPCAPNATRLCDLLPFYLRPGGQEFNTDPVEYLPLSADGTFRQRSGDNPYVQKFPNLTTNLTLYKRDAFHLRLNTHRAILDDVYTTTIRIALTNGAGDKIYVRNETGVEVPVVLAERTVSSKQNLGVSAFTDGTAASSLRTTTDSVTRSLSENLSSGDVLSTVVRTVHDNCRENTGSASLAWTVAGANLNQTCGNFYGYVGYQGVKPCQPPTQIGTPGAVLHQVYLAIRDRAPCKPNLMTMMNATAADGDNTTREFTREVGPTVNTVVSTVLAPPDPSELNWFDFFLDAEQPRLRPADMPAFSETSETITVPPGYGMMMEMYITSGGITASGGTFGTLWRSTLGMGLSAMPEYPIGGSACIEDPSSKATACTPSPQPVARDVNAQTNGTRSACMQCIGDSLYHDTAYNGTSSQRSESSSVGVSIDTLIKSPIPIAFFFFGDAQGTGADSRQLPARLEVRVPTEPATSVDIKVEDVETGEPVATLLEDARAVGDEPGSPTLLGRRFLQSFNETGVLKEEHAVYTPRVRPTPGPSGGPTDDSLRFTQYRYNFSGTIGDRSLPNGVYRLNVTASDDSTQVADTKLSTFVLDAEDPQVQITTNPFVGNVRLENSALPVEWEFTDAHSGPYRAWVLYRVGTPDGASHVGWVNATTRPTGFDPQADAFPAAIKRYLFQGLGREKTYSFVVVGQDRAGNIEHDAGAHLPLASRIYWSAMNKVEAGQFATITLDQTLPSVTADVISGARRTTFQSSEFSFVKAGSPVTFRACALDGDVNVARVEFIVSHVLPDGKTLTRVLPAHEAGTCSQGRVLWTHSGWGDVNADKETYPDGVWGVTVRALDRAANSVTASMGSVILDSEAPRIRLEPPVYPPGQSAVKPNDRLTLRIVATDAFGVDDASIEIDASSLTKQGPLGTRAVRIGGVTMQEATLTVDRSGLQNGQYSVRVSVPDNAGNVNETAFVIPVDFKTFTIRPGSVSVTNVTHNSLVVRWNTTEPTTSQVRFGTTPEASRLTLRSPLNSTLTTDHVVLVENLSPATRYFLRGVSATPGGYVNETDTLEAPTLSALYLVPVAPEAGTPLRGPVDVRFRGGLLDGGDPVTFTLEAQAEENAPWTFVTTTTETGGDHTLVFNTSRYLDGPTYRLRLTAEFAKEKLSATMGPYLTDNTPPRLTVVGPLIATNDTTPRLVAEAEDALARFGVNAATLRIDGEQVDGLLTDTRETALHVAYDVVEPLSAGAHSFELRVVDKAGNVAVESWTIAIDGEAPTVAVNAPRFSPGREAARLGGTVTLNVTVTDGSGVQSVLADTRGVSSQATTRLSRLTGTDSYVGTFPVTDASAAASHRIALTATDFAGNARQATVDVVVDNVPPVVGEARVSDVQQTRATLIADANEPILLVGTVTAPLSPPVQAGGDRLSTHATLPLEGLLPSRTYAYSLQAVDRAGNAVELTGRFQTALDTQAPAGVTGFSVLDLLNGTLRLRWSEATDDVGIAFYRVYRSADGGATFRPIAEVRGLAYDDARLPLETPYTYQVVAVDHGGNEGPASERLRASATALPRLTGGLVTPPLGGTDTVFRYVVTYVSPGGVAPVHVRVILDGAAQDMRLQPGGSPEEGLTYVYESRLAPHKRDAPHTYTFEASDGRYAVHFPEASEPLRGPLVSGDAQASSPLGSAAAFAQRVPIVGAAGVTLALAAAAVIVLVLRRRGA